MYEKRDRYLRDRAMRKSRREDMASMDYRGYRSERDNRYDSRRDRHRLPYEEMDIYDERPREPRRFYDYAMRDSRYYRDYRDYRDYSNEDYKKEYEEDLKEWAEKLKKFDKFGLSKNQVIQKAEEMGVKFKDFDEEEFYAIYLMHISDYPNIAAEMHTYLSMTKDWLEDSDLKISPSEKVCRYLYEIVMADED